MADADVTITAGTGTKIDTRTVGAGADEHRQVVVLGDPATAANVAFVTADNRLQVKTDYSATPAVTSVAITVTSSTLLAADATNGRIGVILYNDTAQILYILLGTGTASTTNFSFEMPPGAYWESPRNYVHAITGIWPSTTGGGSARVTAF